VAASDFFCTNTEWMKNRGVTLGCGGTNYCPANLVTRGEMAAFMNRLGTALTPAPLMTEQNLSAVDLDVETFHCVSPVYTVTGYPRNIVLTGHFSGLTGAAAAYGVTIRYNTDGNATTFPNVINGSFEFTGSTGVSWTHSSTSATLDLAVGSTYRFAIRALRAATGGGTGDLTDGRCHLLQILQNRNSSTSPLDRSPPIGADE
ncbi:MAG TPA: hypothetical protein VNE58_14075, partial [Casimicrobiaceae bacterium]|nr:hypothetical protein [Casimicrobiaceae bacterium]